MKTEISKIYKMTPMQKGMLYEKMINNENAYFEQMCFCVNDNLDIDILEKSYQSMVLKYDVFRTVFRYEKINEPMQVVIKNRKATIHYDDLTGFSKKEILDYIEQFKKADIKKGFDLRKDILSRISVFKVADNKYHFIWSFHHIIIDGWCLNKMIRELFYNYNCILNNINIPEDCLYSYSDYIKWLDSYDDKKALEFWNQYLKGYTQKAIIPLDNVTNKDTYRLKQHSFKLSDDMTQKLINISKSSHVTLNSLFQTVWGIILQKLNNCDDVVFGTVVSGRPTELEGANDMIGLFINTIPVRIQSQKDMNFSELLLQVQKNAVEALKYHHSSLAQIQSATSLKNTLINSLVVFENYPKKIQATLSDTKFKISNFSLLEQTGYNLNIIVVPGNNLEIIFNYNANVFDDLAIIQIKKYFNQVFNSIINTQIKLEDIHLMSEEQQEEIINEYDNTQKESLENKTIVDIFYESVNNNKEKIALIHQDQILTYGELNNRSNIIANEIIKLNIGNAVVAILAERSFDMVSSILGILKSGAAYLPVDVNYPNERIEYILNDSAELVLTSKKFKHKIPNAIKTIFFEDISFDQLFIDITMRPKPTDLAYIIYTSGSTGKPKGVMIEHRSVVNGINCMNSRYEITDKDVFAQKASITFDFSVWELFWWFWSGAKLCLLEPGSEKDPEAIIQEIYKQNISILCFVPSMLSSFLDYIKANECQNKLKSLRYVLSGGEILTPRLVSSFYELIDAKLINIYGPTETTVCVSYYNCQKDVEYNRVPIGKPIDNTKLLVLSEDLTLQPIGVIGELAVAGVGVSRGYINNELLTNEKFIKNPFNKKETIYLTGDLAKRLPDGNLDYIGRRDNQVKIRGFRIELDEVETTIKKHPFVKDVIVKTVEYNNDKALCAYIIANKNEIIEAEDIKIFSSGFLPEYMIPSYFVFLEEFPLLDNGKVDRNSLVDPREVIDQTQKENKILPLNENQKILIKLFKEILGLTNISLEDNFFNLGGDSIKAIQLSARLSKYGMSLNIEDVFNNPTVKKLSEKLKKINNNCYQDIVHGEVPLSPIQLSFFEKNKNYYNHFCQSVEFKLNKRISSKDIVKIMNTILKHHDALRMQYIKDSGKMKQVNNNFKENLFEIFEYDFRGIDNWEEEMLNKQNQIYQTFNLETGELVKIGHFLSDSCDYILIAIHHIVIDGVSWRILIEDFINLYNAAINNSKEKLPPKTQSYQYWSNKLLEYSKGSKFDKQLSHWKNMLKNFSVEETENSSCKLTFDKIPYAQEISKKDTVNENQICKTFEIEKDLVDKMIGELSRKYGITIEETLIAGLLLTLNEWAKLNKIVVSLEGHGRNNIYEPIDISRTIGWFTSEYPFCFDMHSIKSDEHSDIISKNVDMISFLMKIKQSLKAIPDKGIGYGILKYLTPENLKGGINFDITPEIKFNYLGELIKKEYYNNQDISVSNFCPGNVIGNKICDCIGISIDALLLNSSVYFNVYYNKLEYTNSAIEDFISRYKGNIRKIVNLLQKTEIVSETYKEIPEKTSISNIIPFRDVFYKDCYFNALLPIISLFYGNIDLFIANDIYLYSYDSNKKGLPFSLKNINIADETRLLDLMGIGVKKKNSSQDIILDIKNALEKKHPVIIRVDCFYTIIRKDMYKKEHWPHVLLVTGYNDKKRIFQVIEHDNINSTDYKLMAISYDSLTEAYNKAVEQFQDDISSSYFEFFNKSHCKKVNPLSTYKYNLQQNKIRRLEGVESLLELKSYLEVYLQDSNYLKMNIDDIVFSLNNIINNKKIEKYIMDKLLNEDKIQDSTEIILSEWDLIRKIFLKAKFTNKDKGININKILESIDRIYHAEKMLNSLIFRGEREEL